jgi:hypothetical protein
MNQQQVEFSEKETLQIKAAENMLLEHSEGVDSSSFWLTKWAATSERLVFSSVSVENGNLNPPDGIFIMRTNWANYSVRPSVDRPTIQYLHFSDEWLSQYQQKNEVIYDNGGVSLVKV